MKKIETILKEESVHLKRMLQTIEKRLEKAPKGHLRIMKKRGGAEYYCDGKYLKKSEAILAKRLAQRDYDVLVKKKAQGRIKAIEGFLKVYEDTDLKNIFQRLTPQRKNLVLAEELPDEEYIKRWQAVEYKGKPFLNEENVIVTERGERVRSKSEKIIADKLYLLGIPYRYEYPVVLDGNIMVYPDFTILKMPERKEMILEHFGRMDDTEYAESVLRKLGTYEKSGRYLGVNLFFTYETGKRALNTRMLERLLKELFCAEA